MQTELHVQAVVQENILPYDEIMHPPPQKKQLDFNMWWWANDESTPKEQQKFARNNFSGPK